MARAPPSRCARSTPTPARSTAGSHSRPASGPLRRGRDGSPDRATSDPCPPIPVVDSGAVPGWKDYVRAAAAKKFDSVPGLLGEHLASQGVCVQAVGAGAGVGAAFRSGAMPRYAPFAPDSADVRPRGVSGDAGRRGLAARPQGRRRGRGGAQGRPRLAGQGDRPQDPGRHRGGTRGRRPRRGQPLRCRAPASGCGSSRRRDPRFGQRHPGLAVDPPARTGAGPRPHRDAHRGYRGPGAQRARRRGPAAGPGRQQLRGRGPRPAAGTGRLRRGLPRGALARPALLQRRRLHPARDLRPRPAGLEARLRLPGAPGCRLLQVVRRVARGRGDRPGRDLPGQPPALVALPRADARRSSPASALFVAVISAIALLGPWGRCAAGPHGRRSRSPRCSSSPSTS